MKITVDQVAHVAQLARLTLEEAELQQLTSQMDAILGYVEQLSVLDTSDILPTAHAVPLENAFRPDAVKAPLGVDRALSNAPESRDSCFRVPKVIE